MARNKTGTGLAWAGWVLFGGALLIVTGAMNIAEGAAALIDDSLVVAARRQLVLVDITGWAWTLISFGIILCLTGAGLFTAQPWARVTAIVAVGMHATANALWIGAHPAWSLLMIGLDTVAIFALTARWSAAQQRLDPYAEVREVPARSTVDASPPASTPVAAHD